MRIALTLTTILLAGVLRAFAEDSPPAAGSPIDVLPPDVKAAYNGIRGDRILPTIRFLASPRLEGRDAGERGAEVAADYLVSRFQAAGMVAGTKDGFLQRFDLRYRTLHPDEALLVKRQAGGATLERSLEVGRHFRPFNFSEEGSVEAPLVFGGFGISAPEHGWDDYAALGAGGAKGKIVVVLRHEPLEEGTGSWFDGREMTLHASLRAKARAAASHGAVGLIVVDDPVNHETPSDPSSGLTRLSLLSEKDRKRDKDDPKRPKGSVDVEVQASTLGVIGGLCSQELLRVLAPERDWKALQQEMESSRRPMAFALPGCTARLVHRLEEERRETANVVALLPGSDPEASKEYVLIGGHYDHVGKDERTDEVYHGADDNASGTAAVLAAAEAFASLPVRPRRSLLFVAFAAEEKGLLGSLHFAYHLPVPAERIVAAINMDMVGRNKETEMSVVGRSETPDLAALVDKHGPTVGFQINDDAGAGAARSDNASLWMAGIPTVSFFSGTHEDYHEPSDTADKVAPGKVEKAARLAFLVARDIADGAVTPKRLDVPRGAWKPVAPPAKEEGR